MKTTSSQEKKQLSQQMVLIFSLLLASLGWVKAQSITVTPLDPPCQDSVIDVNITLSGVNLPIVIEYYDGLGYHSINMTTLSTTVSYSVNGILTNNNFSGTDPVTLVTIYAPLNLNPFTYTSSLSIIPGTCPNAQYQVNLSGITGGTAPYTINYWDETAQNLLGTGNPINLPQGNYNLQIIDANGCSNPLSDSIMYGIMEVNSNLTFSITSTTASCTNGTATASGITGGTAPYTYLWSNGANTSTISGLVQGLYACTVTDANGDCETIQTYVDQTPYLGAMTTSNPANCLNADGDATVFPTVGGVPPYTYLWDNGSTTQTVNNLTPGFHTGQFTDANGCIGIYNVNIPSLSPVAASYSSTPSSCTLPTGSATLNISGGVMPYTISWPDLGATTSTVNNLPPGNYYFNVTDANGCERDGYVHIYPMSIISASIGSIDAVCPTNLGSLLMNATSSALPLTYNWSNGASTASLINVPASSYSCVITDANGCMVTKTGSIHINSPIGISFSTTNASCIFNADGTATATVFGGMPPYTYSWGSNSISGLASGIYPIMVQDANGCTKTDYVFVASNNNNSCYCTIDGIVYNDLNSNCMQDVGEPGIPNVMINTNGGGYAFSNNSGYYSIIVPNGNYVVEEITQPGIYSLTGCQANNIAVSTGGGGCVQTVNFANNVVPIHDIHIFTYNNNQPIPGNNYYQQLVTVNQGTLAETNVQLSYVHDGQLSYLNSSSPTFTQPNAGAFPNWYTENSGLNINTGSTVINQLSYYTPTSMPIGTSMYFRDTASYMAPLDTYWMTNEQSPWNNIIDLNVLAVSSYDPNYKEVTPKGVGPEGYITQNDSILRYIVHFENNGTANAQKVVVKDTLDDDFNLETFQPLYASHHVEITISDDRVATFTFNNINLAYTPVGVYNPFAQGALAFTIHLNHNLPVNTELTNNAAIYFDYNAPVITNTTLNTIDDNLSVIENPEENRVILFPNPATHVVYIKPTNEAEIQQVSIYDVNGKLVQLCKNTESLVNGIQVSGLPNGLYIISIQTSQNIVKQKLLIQH
jgi:uncharacterized repeat protein (TIGR01451 family)